MDMDEFQSAQWDFITFSVARSFLAGEQYHVIIRRWEGGIV
jgi:hypothetical protein